MSSLDSLFAVVVIGALAPVISGLLPGKVKIPPVIFMLVGGILIGPEFLGWAESADVELLSILGLSFLFLLAGYELEPSLMRQAPGKLALRGWIVSVVLATVIVIGLNAIGQLASDYQVVIIALTTTALGTLIPILRESGMLSTTIGPYIFAAGAAGEFMPIVAMALLLSGSGPIEGLFALTSMAVITFLALMVIRRLKDRDWHTRLGLSEDSTGQSTLRWTVLLLTGLVLFASDFGLDVVLGAFLAGMVLRQWAPGDRDRLELKLEAVGYGVLIPIFFVDSGIKLDIRSIMENPRPMVALFVLLFVARGLPALFIYRSHLDLRGRWQMVFLSATALPLLVALSEVGVQSDLMSERSAAAMVGAGVLSVLVFPLVAVVLHLGRAPAPEDAQV